MDIRADIYSLGCTLYYCLTGKPPFPGGTDVQKLIRHQTEKPYPIEELRPGLPQEVHQVLNRMLEKRPEDRYQTPQQLADALDLYLSPAVPNTPVPASIAETPPVAETPVPPTRPKPAAPAPTVPARPVPVGAGALRPVRVGRQPVPGHRPGPRPLDAGHHAHAGGAHRVPPERAAVPADPPDRADDRAGHPPEGPLRRARRAGRRAGLLPGR